MNRSVVILLSLFALFFFPLAAASPSLAESRPFQASLTPDFAVHDRGVMIEGLSIGLWGENPQRALALGIANGSTGESAGFSWGLLLNYAETYKGVHWAGVNYTKQDFFGWQSGLINYTDRHLKGLQTGFVNYTRRAEGVQLGLFNYAETANFALQVGIVNVIRENTWFRYFPDSVAPAMVFVNWRF